jgi:hypothetical protein
MPGSICHMSMIIIIAIQDAMVQWLCMLSHKANCEVLGSILHKVIQFLIIINQSEMSQFNHRLGLLESVFGLTICVII